MNLSSQGMVIFYLLFSLGWQVIALHILSAHRIWVSEREQRAARKRLKQSIARYRALKENYATQEAPRQHESRPHCPGTGTLPASSCQVG